ncbi:Glycerol-3-phosphate dehydrogenase 2 [Dyadobacter sp. CECT 9275]|uniref:Glycerol-3-phosphate dehydrogenase 2 n=1 Tax=Dyadobacter helix TaxID=2822344 RepID=A0A916JC87_9BACT|nr:FAD-dependent oxidoreductase [Dyadobacter sp. CECT 9275]CAG4995005.1 Glycerol-3-phosphate dehydrogenase 2 [Dyadobacter sp. CECT 9275]
MNRDTAITRLENEEFDICIIGAGASGAGCALDAVLRGYKVALVDQGDFASQTSSISTKLIHGGVRYLEQAFKKLDFAQLKQVRHGLEERHTLLKNAPHLARPLALLTPVSSWLEGLYFTIGLRLYDQFAINDSLPKSKWLSKKKVLELMPTLNRHKLHSAVMYYDGQMDDARYCLALVQSAVENGAVTANYISVTGFGKERNGKINRVKARDIIGDKELVITAKLVINCTGPFSDHVRQMANAELYKRIRPSKGVHLVLPPGILKSDCAMLIPKTSDGRVVFAIPFEGATMLGTTDTEYSETGEIPVLNQAEKEYLADTLNPYLENKMDLRQITAGFGGIRPLLSADPGKSTKSLVRDHEVEVDPSSGLISLLGGKWTTYRLMAKDTLDVADRIAGKLNDCLTANYVLAGGELYRFDQWKEMEVTYCLAPDICQHLLKKYGSRAEKVVRDLPSNPDLGERLHPGYPYIKAEVIFAATSEMAVTPRDFLARRIRLEITDWQAALDCVPVVADLMASVLGWDDEKKKEQILTYSGELKYFMAMAGKEIRV